MRYKRQVTNAGAAILLLALGYLALVFGIAAFPSWFAYAMPDEFYRPVAFSTVAVVEMAVFWALVAVMVVVERGRRRAVR